ncbi:MAG: LuxR family transcriptional regulator [Spirulina sp. SIO3F2]|nr:LuxR family transcriptional regulator [Spirulina sp. SIO3F2]
MDQSLPELFAAIATATDEPHLRSRLMDRANDTFGVQRWGLYLLDKAGQLASVDVVGVSDAFVERYQQIGRSVDPLLQYVLSHHAPIHEALIWPNGGWRQSELYQRCCAEYDHAHIMTGPIVGQGQLVGTIHFARVGQAPLFNGQDLASLGALCSHVSARLAELRALEHVASNPWRSRLTSRERQIADLVARGLTNAAIGQELWITQNSVKQALKRMFRKLEVRSRTEMVTKLQIY